MKIPREDLLSFFAKTDAAENEWKDEKKRRKSRNLSFFFPRSF